MKVKFILNLVMNRPKIDEEGEILDIPQEAAFHSDKEVNLEGTDVDDL